MSAVTIGIRRDKGGRRAEDNELTIGAEDRPSTRLVRSWARFVVAHINALNPAAATRDNDEGREDHEDTSHVASHLALSASSTTLPSSPVA